MYTTSTRVEGQPAPSTFIISDGQAFAAPHPFPNTAMENNRFSTLPGKHNEGTFAHHEYEQQGDGQRQLEEPTKRTGAHKIRHDILCGVGEFAGTFLFLLCSFLGAQSAIYNRSVGEAVAVAANDNEVSMIRLRLAGNGEPQ